MNAVVVGIGFVGKMMMGCRMVDKVFVAMMVVDKMVGYSGMVDLD